MKLVQTLALSLVIAAVTAPSFAEEKVETVKVAEAEKADAADVALATEAGKVEKK